jgi:hypothetical protein
MGFFVLSSYYNNKTMVKKVVLYEELNKTDISKEVKVYMTSDEFKTKVKKKNRQRIKKIIKN